MGRLAPRQATPTHASVSVSSRAKTVNLGPTPAYPIHVYIPEPVFTTTASQVGFPAPVLQDSWVRHCHTYTYNLLQYGLVLCISNILHLTVYLLTRNYATKMLQYLA